MKIQNVLELGPADTRAFVERILDPRDPDELPALQAAIQSQKQVEKRSNNPLPAHPQSGED